MGVLCSGPAGFLHPYSSGSNFVSKWYAFPGGFDLWMHLSRGEVHKLGVTVFGNLCLDVPARSFLTCVSCIPSTACDRLTPVFKPVCPEGEQLFSTEKPCAMCVNVAVRVADRPCQQKRIEP